MKRRHIFITITLLTALAASAKKNAPLAPSFAWEASMPLGDTQPAPIDTSEINYAQTFVPTMVSSAWATTGNLGAQGLNMIYPLRLPATDFFFVDPLRHWIPSLDSFTFYNTRIPMTLLGYSFGGGSDNNQDRLSGVFSGNVNKSIQIGACLDYLYSKGAYANQATKDFTYGFSGSYMGERYKLQTSIFLYNLLNKENGGITDDLYITDPAEVQGGQTHVNAKQIPTNLNDAHTRVRGMDFFLNNRYSLGYHRVEKADTDTVARRIFVPAADIIYTLQARTNSHLFTNKSASGNTPDFWTNNYYTLGTSYDKTSYTFISNTVGIAMLEGFRKWVKAGLTAFMTYEYNRYRLPSYTYEEGAEPEGLTPKPEAVPDDAFTEHNIYVGARLSSNRNRYFDYDVSGRIGLVGVPGEFEVDGSMTGSIPLLRDTLAITGYASISNTGASPLLEHYRSNHFIWDRSFDLCQAFRFGGRLSFPRSGTALDVGTETLTNAVYLGPDCLPVQHSGGVPIFWARLEQKLAFRALHWDNTITYQASGNADVVPLPALAVYSNLYVTVTLAKVLRIQAGIDCDYYTRYRAPGYQPALGTFYNQDVAMAGNYPFMNLYINMKLKRARFYVMMSHINQGLTGSNYFALPHYPMNPRRFQLGVSVDFAN